MPDSNITKHAIAAALKELCREKSFDKISIADITSTCGLNRQTFYYHFEDKYELLNWIYYTEGVCAAGRRNYAGKLGQPYRSAVRDHARG